MQVMFVEMHPMSARVARHGKSEYHMKKMKYEFKMHHLQKPVESPTDTCFIRLRIQSCREKRKEKKINFKESKKIKRFILSLRRKHTLWRMFVCKADCSIEKKAWPTELDGLESEGSGGEIAGCWEIT